MVTQADIAHMERTIQKQGKLIKEISREFLSTGNIDVNDLTGLGRMARIQDLINEYEQAS